MGRIRQLLAAVAVVPTKAMAKPKKDPIREDRIRDEVIVDANGPEEQAMGWYYYLADKLQFPFQAKCVVSKVVSPLRKAQQIAFQQPARGIEQRQYGAAVYADCRCKSRSPGWPAENELSSPETLLRDDEERVGCTENSAKKA